MEQTETTQQAINQMYEYAANLFIGGKNAYEVKEALMERGLNEDSATAIADGLEQEIAKAKKDKAQKDMLYGALWCVGGIALTMANVGFIFWGAIVFGAIQFFRGLASL